MSIELVTELRGAPGPKGDTGATGAAGSPGVRGSRIWPTTADPTASGYTKPSGALVGDYYLYARADGSSAIYYDRP